MQCSPKHVHAREKNDSTENSPTAYETCGDGYGQQKLCYGNQGEELVSESPLVANNLPKTSPDDEKQQCMKSCQAESFMLRLLSYLCSRLLQCVSGQSGVDEKLVSQPPHIRKKFRDTFQMCFPAH